MLPRPTHIIVAIALLAQAATAPADPGGRRSWRSPFCAEVSAHWQEWDANHDNTLSPAEIDRLVVNPNVKGDEAVAVAVLKFVVRQRKRWGVEGPAFDRRYFDEIARSDWTRQVPDWARDEGALDAAASSPSASPKAIAAAPTDYAHFPYDLSFNAYRKKLAASPRTLFTERKPSLDTLHQGAVGDCFFLAAVGSMLYSDRASVERMIRPLSYGTYRVSFPGEVPVIVPDPTEAEICLAGTTDDTGLWLLVLEKALGALQMRELSPAERGYELLDSIDHGGKASQAIALLTGHAVVALRGMVERAEPADAYLPKLRATLKATFADRRVMTAGTSAPTLRDRLPPGLVPLHLYAILAYDAEADRVELWNPWGQDFKPKGKAGPENGYAATHGRFSMPLAEFYRFFRMVAYEGGETPDNATDVVLISPPRHSR